MQETVRFFSVQEETVRFFSLPRRARSNRSTLYCSLNPKPGLKKTSLTWLRGMRQAARSPGSDYSKQLRVHMAVVIMVDKWNGLCRPNPCSRSSSYRAHCGSTWPSLALEAKRARGSRPVEILGPVFTHERPGAARAVAYGNPALGILSASRSAAGATFHSFLSMVECRRMFRHLG